MKQLISALEGLKKSKIKPLIDSRIKEFKRVGEGIDKKLFSELCFCIMTANFQAEKSIKIQAQLCDSFPEISEKKLAQQLKELGHRFPNTRAKYIFEARKHHKLLGKTLNSFKDDLERREWLVDNVKGLGMKEASHFLRNIGYKNYAIIDFHIVDLLSDNGLIEKPKNKSIPKNSYLEIEEILRALGEKTGLNQAELDLYLWYMETGKILK